MAYGQSGAQRQSFDFSENKSGFRNTVEALNVTDRGERTTIGTQRWTGSNIRSENINTWDEKKGPASPEAMWNAAIIKSDTPAMRISQAHSVPERIKEETTQADKFAEALSSRVSSQGSIVTHTSAEGRGSISLKTPDIGGLSPVAANASGNVSIGRSNIEQHNFSLYQGVIRGFQDERRQNVEKYGESYANRVYTSRLHELAKGTDELIKGKTEFSFGASAVVGEPIEEAKAMMNKMDKGTSSKNSGSSVSGEW